MKLFKKYSKFIKIGTATIALSGIFFPLVNISVHLLGTADISFGLIDILRSLSDEASHEVFDLVTSDILSSDIGMHIFLLFAAYILAIILTVITLILTFTNKLKIVKIAFVSTATILMVYTGIRINALPEVLIYYLEETLVDHLDGFIGFLTSIIDFSNIFEINLGLGYWITLSALLLLLMLLIIIKTVKPRKSRIKKG